MGPSANAHLGYIYMHDPTSPNFQHKSPKWSLVIFYVAISIMQLCHGAIKIQVCRGGSARMFGSQSNIRVPLPSNCIHSAFRGALRDPRTYWLCLFRFLPCEVCPVLYHFRTLLPTNPSLRDRRSLSWRPLIVIPLGRLWFPHLRVQLLLPQSQCGTGSALLPCVGPHATNTHERMGGVRRHKNHRSREREGITEVVVDRSASNR